MLTDGKSSLRKIIVWSSSMLIDGKSSSRRIVELELDHVN